VWLNGANDWIYRHLHKAEERMVEMARRYVRERPSPATEEALNQMARELLLAQSSDWAFLMTVGSATPYAEKRTRTHLHRFTRLYQMIHSGKVARKYVAGLYASNPIFPDVDYRAWL
jgi:1,4-alpha-glucan branching enzyme